MHLPFSRICAQTPLRSPKRETTEGICQKECNKKMLFGIVEAELYIQYRWGDVHTVMQ